MRARSIMITPVLNGFIVKVGCQDVVFRSLDDLVREIEHYYRNPEDVEKLYLKNAVNKVDAVRAGVGLIGEELEGADLGQRRPVGIGTPEPSIANVHAR